MFLRRRSAPLPPVPRRIPFEGGALLATPHAGAVSDEVADFLVDAWPVVAALAHEGCRTLGAGLVRVPWAVVADTPPLLLLPPRLGYVPAHALAASPFAARPHPALRGPGPDALDTWLVDACEHYDTAASAVLRIDGVAGRPGSGLGLIVASRTLPPDVATTRIRALLN